MDCICIEMLYWMDHGPYFSLFDINNLQTSGIPVLFLPGNRGSYKQSRSIASETSLLVNRLFSENSGFKTDGKREFDFFAGLQL